MLLRCLFAAALVCLPIGLSGCSEDDQIVLPEPRDPSVEPELMGAAGEMD